MPRLSNSIMNQFALRSVALYTTLPKVVKEHPHKSPHTSPMIVAFHGDFSPQVFEKFGSPHWTHFELLRPSAPNSRSPFNDFEHHDRSEQMNERTSFRTPQPFSGKVGRFIRESLVPRIEGEL